VQRKKAKKFDIDKMEIILATDCGSTTTKARLFMKKDRWRYVCSGEAPTTVERPYEDVTMGVRNAVREIEELTGLKLLAEQGIIKRSSSGKDGVDLYVSTSSAGGGLQMVVIGATKSITAESANRAALGGGAIVMDVMAISDNVPLYKKIEKMRHLRPDIVLISGGTDGGATTQPVQASEILKLSDPKPRFGQDFKLPVIYAGNVDAREKIKEILADKFSLTIVDNLRPTVELENTDAARDAIQKLFMEHVMSHAPGYDKLKKWVDTDIMPTPRGEGMMFKLIADTYSINVIGVGLGGATTNIYSIFDGKFVRSVSANLGMSYSIRNVLREAGKDNILRWIPFDLDVDEFCDMLSNKMIRPTTIPQTLEELVMEHAVAREAIRLAFMHHKYIARGLRGVRPVIKGLFDVSVAGKETYIDMLRVDLIGGTGGLLSHAPRRVQSALVLIDSFEPEGITYLIQDSVFMMPHLGVLSTVHPNAALEIFEHDCLVPLGTCIAPKGQAEKETEVMSVDIKMPDETVKKETVRFGEIKCVPIPAETEVEVKIDVHRNFDVGAGKGDSMVSKVKGGVVGLILDGRGRPLQLPTDEKERKRTLLKWLTALKAYPEEFLKKCGGE